MELRHRPGGVPAAESRRASPGSAPAASPGSRRDTTLFFLSVAGAGLGVAMVDSSFNNYLRSAFDLGGLARSALELPRELPGALNVLLAAALAFLPARRIGAAACVLQSAGILLLALLSRSFGSMTFWLFLYSLGQHLLMPFQSSLAMELAAEGAEGSVLGNSNAVRNLAQLAGGAAVMIGFRWLGFSFTRNFIFAAAAIMAAALAMAAMSAPKRREPAPRLLLRRRYGLFYMLSVLYGTRKQLFITFAPWVIVSVFGKGTSTVAALYLMGGAAGVLFQPILGRAVDRLGVRTMLGLEATLLVPICILYGFSASWFSNDLAFAVVAVCYIADSLLVSFGMARSVYLKRIAVSEADVAPTLSMGIALDHVFSIVVALAAGYLWDRVGFRWVFAGGALIAVLNFTATRFLPRSFPLRGAARG